MCFVYLTLSGLSSQAGCLANLPTTLEPENTWADAYDPGQLWSPDDQCKMMYGQNASFCQVQFVLLYFHLILLSWVM